MGSVPDRGGSTWTVKFNAQNPLSFYVLNSCWCDSWLRLGTDDLSYGEVKRDVRAANRCDLGGGCGSGGGGGDGGDGGGGGDDDANYRVPHPILTAQRFERQKRKQRWEGGWTPAFDAASR